MAHVYILYLAYTHTHTHLYFVFLQTFILLSEQNQHDSGSSATVIFEHRTKNVTHII